MSDMQQYKCPCCGGALEFNVSGQNMKCPYCNTEFDMETVKQYDESLNQHKPDNQSWEMPSSQWGDGETGDMKIYICKSCGGEIIGDDTMASTDCPYCGNHVVLMGQFSGDLKPDCVIPFKLDKNAAKEGLKKHISTKKLVPKLFKSENHLDEIKGIYVPFWLFDTEADAQVNYRATKVRTWSDSRYRYTETSYFDVFRSGSLAFQNIPVDGSTKMEDNLMESLEPFNVNDAVDFQTAYLSGYLADKYDVSAEQSVSRANERVKRSAEDVIRDTVVGYNTVNVNNSSIQHRNGKSKYALYPIWLLNTTWRDKKYTFAMNGQTGKFIGDLPVDWGKFWMWFGILAAIFGSVAYGLLWIWNFLL